VSAAPAEPAPAGDMVVSVDWLANVDCIRRMGSPIHNWPVKVRGVFGLNRDRSYSMELNFSGFLMRSWTLSWDGRLGGAPVQTRGAAAELRVGGPHSLRAIFHEPNNDIVWNVDVDESGCRATVNAQLHPGKTVYTLYNGDPQEEFRYQNCPAIRTNAATCTAR
jgi:hypothetical protein